MSQMLPRPTDVILGPFPSLSSSPSVVCSMRFSTSTAPLTSVVSAVGTNGASILAGAPMLFNAADNLFQAERNNSAYELLPAADRTVQTDSAIQTNFNWRTIQVQLFVNANPGGAESLILRLSAGPDETATGLLRLASTPPIVAGVDGTGVILAGPGVTATGEAIIPGIQQIAVSTMLARRFSVRVIPSGAGIWNYTVWVSLGV